jgi:aminopeptidase-like protein
MMLDPEKNTIDFDKAGSEMYELISELYPICRSITGDGVRNTLKIVARHIPLRIYEIPTGTKVFDWEVPKEWNIRDAFIKDSKGNKILDFNKLNLSVLNYSIPVNKHVNLDELKKHIFTLPDKPDLVPYKTSYYKENWGFCMPHNQLLSLKDETYHVYIDSSLENGSLTYGELLIKGKSTDEVLISTHVCHPSLCNDNLSGIVIATYIAKYLIDIKTKYTCRFLFIPGTIGSITWLSINEKTADKIKHGLVITLLGDNSDFTYKKSRVGNAEIDKSVEIFLSTLNKPFTILDFVPYGYDERQYCSPGFNLPVGCFTRKPYGEFPEYHTSADNLEFVRPEKLGESLQALLDILYIIENNETYINLNPKCEPQLGRRGLYDAIGGTNESKIVQLATLWVLNFSDGFHSLLDIAMKSKIKFRTIKNAADALFKCNLIKKK